MECYACYEYFTESGAESSKPGNLASCGNLHPSNVRLLHHSLNTPHTVSKPQNAFICIVTSLIYIISNILTYCCFVASLLLCLTGNSLQVPFSPSASSNPGSLSKTDVEGPASAFPDWTLPVLLAVGWSFNASVWDSAPVVAKTCTSNSSVPTGVISLPAPFSCPCGSNPVTVTSSSDWMLVILAEIGVCCAGACCFQIGQGFSRGWITWGVTSASSSSLARNLGALAQHAHGRQCSGCVVAISTAGMSS